MISKGYRVTVTIKILVLEFLLCFIGMTCGFTWEIYAENNRWDNLIYPGIKIAGVDLGGKTKDEAKAMVEKEYIKLLTNRKFKVATDAKIYEFEVAKYIKEYNTSKVVENVFDFGKGLSALSKYKLIKDGVTEHYSIPFIFNENYVSDFIKTIENDLSKEPVNASLEKYPSGKFEVKPDTKGVTLEAKQLEKLIKESVYSDSGEEIVIKVPVDEKSAKITAEMLSSINTNVSSFSTSLKTSSSERAKNVEIASNFINGRTLMPGDVFSYNDIVGERTKERGFEEAPVIVGNKVESGLGGGICQVSSTLYNAILKAGINSIKRTKHTLPSSYVGLGLDATVVWGAIDFKFTNTLQYPMYIESYIEDRVLYINIYSDSSIIKRTYEIKNDIYNRTKAAFKVLEDPNLPLGQTYTVQKGYDGYKVKVIRDTYENGILINSEIISNDFYRPVDNIVRKGIGTSQ